MQVLVAAAIMALGLGVYLLDRPADRVYFVPDWWQRGADIPLIFGSLGGNLPSFAHVFFFTLITAAILAPWRLRMLSICLFWFCFDGLFELAQHEAIAVRLAEFVPAWFLNVALLENTRPYLLAGTFDPLDILSLAAGSLLAYVTLRVMVEREHKNDP